jgi:hypothetical protein
MLLAACRPVPQQASPAASPAPSAISADTALPTQERLRLGQWQVEALDGWPLPGEHHPIHLLVGRSGGEGQSQCIPLGFNWPGMDRPLAFAPAPQPREGRPTQFICTRGLTPIEQRLEPILATAQDFTVEGDGSLTVTSPRGSLRLRRPSEPVLNPQGQTSIDPALMWGAWQVAALDDRVPSAPMHLLVFRQRLELISGCVGIGRLLERTGPDLLLTTDPGLRTTCERMTSPDERAAERILSGPVRVILSEPRRRVLRGTGGSITLVR